MYFPGQPTSVPGEWPLLGVVGIGPDLGSVLATGAGRVSPDYWPVDGYSKAYGKPDQAPSKRHDQLEREYPREAASQRERAGGEQDRWSYKRQKVEDDSPHARDRVYGGEHERGKKIGQERECAQQPKPPQAARPECPHRDRGEGQDQGENKQRDHRRQ